MAVNDPIWSYGELRFINAITSAPDPEWSYGELLILYQYAAGGVALPVHVVYLDHKTIKDNLSFSALFTTVKVVFHKHITKKALPLLHFLVTAKNVLHKHIATKGGLLLQFGVTAQAVMHKVLTIVSPTRQHIVLHNIKSTIQSCLAKKPIVSLIFPLILKQAIYRVISKKVGLGNVINIAIANVVHAYKTVKSSLVLVLSLSIKNNLFLYKTMKSSIILRISLSLKNAISLHVVSRGLLVLRILASVKNAISKVISSRFIATITGEVISITPIIEFVAKKCRLRQSSGVSTFYQSTKKIIRRFVTRDETD